MAELLFIIYIYRFYFFNGLNLTDHTVNQNTSIRGVDELY